MPAGHMAAYVEVPSQMPVVFKPELGSARCARLSVHFAQGEGIEPSAFLLGSARSAVDVSFVQVGASPPRPLQERNSAPNACLNDDCVVHEHLPDPSEQMDERVNRGSDVQPKRDIN
jgi:hypothetical protein